MRAFFLRLVLFLIPLLFMMAWFYYACYNKQFAYAYTDKDCNKGVWMYSRIFLNQTPLDIAFLGSSHTLCGINDSILEEELRIGYNCSYRVSNLGFCRYGLDVQYSFIKDILKQKKPKYLVLEVREYENTFSHPHFPHIAETSDLLFPSMIINQNYFDNLVIGFRSRLAYLREHTVQTPEVFMFKPNVWNYIPKDHVEDSLVMQEKRRSQAEKASKKNNETDLQNTFSELNHLFPRSYLKKINAVMLQYPETKIIFLYLPSYGTYMKQPNEYELYKSMGKVLIIPDSVYMKPQHWSDPGHLNSNGSKAVSEWLAQQFSQMN